MSYFATLHYNSICTLNVALEIFDLHLSFKGQYREKLGQTKIDLANAKAQYLA